MDQPSEQELIARRNALRAKLRELVKETRRPKGPLGYPVGTGQALNNGRGLGRLKGREGRRRIMERIQP